MNSFLVILVFLIKHFPQYSSFNSSSNALPQDYIPLHYFSLKTLFITNPCHPDQSILIQNHSLYQFDREWKRLYILEKLFHKQTSTVNSIVYLNNDLILIINGRLFRTQDLISSATNAMIIYRLIHYTNIPILLDKIDYAFTTPCCTCLQTTTTHSISHTFNDYVILANRLGNVILFNMKSITVVYDFGNILQTQSICQSNSCTIQYLGLIHSQPILICIIQYQIGKTILFHHPFLEFNSTNLKSTLIDFTGDTLYITPSTIPNAYFLWDNQKIFYTPNAGQLLSEILPNGCQNNNTPTDIDIDYDNLTLLTKEIFCFNITIEYIFVSKQEFFIQTKNHQWFYGRESFFPSMINLKSTCISNQSIPQIDPQCLLDQDNQSYPCSSFAQSYCSYIRFEPLFDIHQINILEKNEEKTWKFILETYTIIPIMISSTKSNFFHYSVSYTIDRLSNGIIRIIGNIWITTIDQTNEDLLGSSMISLRLGLLQYGYSCQYMPSFTFQIEASCSPTSILRVKKTHEYDDWNHSSTNNDVEWFRQNLPANTFRQFSPIYIKRKQSDPIFLNYQYCSNDTCQSINPTESDLFLIYAIPFNGKHENYARYLINRTDSCIPLSRLIYRLWIKWTLNATSRAQLFQIPYERRTFYQTLLNLLSISSESCLFFNASNPIHINQTINQESDDDDLKFLLHIIVLKNSLSFCDLETFLLMEIEPLDDLQNSYRGFIFLTTLFLFLLFFILFIHLYTYYKKQQRRKYLEYHRLNQLDAGQFHQWHDIARYLTEYQNTENYYSMQNYLANLEWTQP